MIMDVEDEMRKKLRTHLPKFVKKINPAELIPLLPCLTAPNSEEIEARQTTRGRYHTVQLLYEILLRKKDGCQQLVAALRDEDINQSELADLLGPPQCEPVSWKEPLPGKAEKGAVQKSKSDISCHPEFKENHGRKPCDGYTLIRDLEATVRSVYKWLDIDGLNDWTVLAGKLKYTVKQVEMFKAHHKESPAVTVIEDWTQKEDPTLETLMKVLNEMERKDMVSELEKITNYKCPDIAHSLAENGLKVEQQVYEQDQLMQTLMKSADNDKTDKVKLPVSNQPQAMTDRHINTQLTPVPVPGPEPSRDNAPNNEQEATVSRQTEFERNQIFPDAEHCEHVNDQSVPDTGDITSLISFEMEYGNGDRNVHSLSSEGSRSLEDVLFKSGDDTSSMQGMKFRYAESKSGQFRMTTFGDSSADETSVQRTEVVPDPATKNQTIVRQESRENYQNPVQTDPSMSSNTFVNLKQERTSGNIRPEMINVKVRQVTDQTSSSIEVSSVGSKFGNYGKLHTEEAPSLSDFSETSETTGTFQEDDNSFVFMNSFTTSVDEVRPESNDNVYSAQNTTSNDGSSDLSANFQTLSLSSSMFCSVHARNDVCIRERRQEELAGAETGSVTDGCYQINLCNSEERDILRAQNSVCTCNGTESIVPYDMIPEVDSINKSGEYNVKNTTELLKFLDEPASLESTCIGESNGQDSFTELKEMDSDPSSQNEQDNVSAQTEVREVSQNEELSQSWSSLRSIGIGLAAGAVVTVALFKKFN